MMVCSEMLVPAMVTLPADTAQRSRFQTTRLLRRCHTVVVVALVCLVVALWAVIRSQIAAGVSGVIGQQDSQPHLKPPDIYSQLPPAYVVTVEYPPDYPQSSVSTRYTAAYYSGVYTLFKGGLCNGRPAYRKGRAEEVGSELVLVQGAPWWAKHDQNTSGLHWTLRFRSKGGFEEGTTLEQNDTQCKGPYQITVMGSSYAVNDGSYVAAWASNCTEQPDSLDCMWQANFQDHSFWRVQVLASTR